eukprot:Gb_12887 [translate_table: standard]
MAEKSQIKVVEEVPGALRVYSDGSILRSDNPILTIPPSQQPSDENGGVLSKDVVLDAHIGLWVRLYLPPQPTSHLPVIILFHGGGFCCFTPAHIAVHSFCLKWAVSLGAIIVSVNYRLAPEHRLPAAYNDSAAAIEWVRSQSMKKKDGQAAEPWLDSHADFSNVYLMGDSAGGNIVHHLIMSRALEDWEPLQIRGGLLVQPFFGGEIRTESEIKCSERAVLNLKMSDTFWRLALPLGTNKNHHFSNPFGPESACLSQMVIPPLLVAVGGKDQLRDRQLRYCEYLKECGKQVEVMVFDEEEHGFYALNVDAEGYNKLMQRAALFVSSSF